MSRDPKIRRFAKALLQMSLEGELVSPERVSAVLGYLEKHPPRHHRGILRDYLYLVRRAVRRCEAVIEHAGPLSEELVQSIQKTLSARYQRPITAAPRENSELIGGLRIHLDCDVFDTSITHHLQRLARSVR